MSIIIPFYNAHEYARETLQSAFASDYPNFEVIVVNDGSTEQESKQFLSDAAQEFRDALALDMGQAFRLGGRGAAHDLTLEARPWGVPLERIEVDVGGPLVDGPSDQLVDELDDGRVFRGDPAEREFIAFWLKDERVVAGLAVEHIAVAER